jgi:hypothetical protein
MRMAFRHLGLVLLVASVLVASVAFGQSLPAGRATSPAQPGSESNSGRAQANPQAGGRTRGPNRAPLDAAEQARREERAQMARDLLELSYSIGATLPGNERAKVLPRQITAASSIDPKLAAQWAEDALPFALELPPGDDRDAVYAGAIPALVSSGPEHALEVFRTLPPDTATGPSFNFALQRLFSTLVQTQGADGMELVRQEALRLSQTSHYPYSAVLNAARALRTGDNQLREAFFDEAAAAYQQGNRSPAGDAEFVRMLMQEWPRVSRPAAQSAFQSVTDNLLARAQREDTEAVAASSSSSTSSAASSSTRNSADSLLRRLLSTLRRFDPELQQKVLQARPSLSGSGGGSGRGGLQAGLSPRGGGFGASQLQPQQDPMRAEQQSFLQYNQARRNPAGALTASTALSDPLARTLALLGAASGLVRKDPAGASAALDRALNAADKITEPAQQLQAAVTMANVAGQMNNTAALRAILDRGFQAAETLQEGDDATEASRAQSTLQRLARSGFQQDPALTLSFVNQVRMPATKAALLIEGAQALARGQVRGGAGMLGGGRQRRVPGPASSQDGPSSQPSPSTTQAESQP